MKNRRVHRAMLRSSVATAALIAFAMPAAAYAQEATYAFDIPAQELNTALLAFGKAARQQIVFDGSVVRGQQTAGLQGDYSPEDGLRRLLAGTDLRAEFQRSGAVRITQDPQGGSAGGGSAVDALIVTAQKREENIQDVPIAISAFSQEALEAQKIEGGFDLLKAIPNVTFSKNNFTSYNFSIRGIGTKAVSATTDPGVSVSFNNTGLIQNRLFEQEYFDIERVEVLRGPQGTLYGRNATSGVINVISAKPDLNDVEGMFKLEVGNYDTKRVSGMVNLPLVEDKLAIRLAGALTDREGYDFNSVTNSPVNGRELWSTRLTVGFEPTEQFRGNFIWERFEEDDDRLRTGKQLCHRDPGKDFIGSTSTHEDDPTNVYNDENHVLGPAQFSQGCLPGSLYDDKAFSTPNGLAIPFVFGLQVLGYGDAFAVGTRDGQSQALLRLGDPYGGMMQSRDMRTMASFRDPRYRANADLFELNLELDLSDELTFYSQTAYVEDEVYSFQDFNRFNTLDVFQDTTTMGPAGIFAVGDWRELAPGGEFCDPQLGCSKTMAGFDISSASAEQFSQEFRLQSNFDGPVNFSAGANYTSFDVLVDYYIMFNLITATALMAPFNIPIDGNVSIDACGISGWLGLMAGEVSEVPAGSENAFCPYIDPNPVESIAGDGHNYFRSKNPYELESWAAFGEVYWNLREDLKLTAGLRLTNDEKRFVPVPSQILMAPGLVGGGEVNRGYPELDPIVQEWQEWTGRIGLDWRPELAFSNDTLLYAFYSRGYKGGGANPPKPGFASEEFILNNAPEVFLTGIENFGFTLPILQLQADEYADTFEPEFVNAFEVGMKNTLLDGGMTFNITGFYYDYKDYQISQTRDRTAVNENFDATIWGIEFETLFAPTRDFQIVANLGYLDTEIADGETSIDIMNRTQGNPDYVLAKSWLQLPSNCVLPTVVVERYLQTTPNIINGQYWQMCGGLGGLLGAPTIFPLPRDPNFGLTPYDVNNYPELNGGAGLMADLGGNELPNAPHWTVNIGAQYSFDWLPDWQATVRGDAYWQSQSWHRVYNSDPYDKLHGWYNVNLSLWLEHEESGIKVEIYAKNLLDETPITDAFLNSDDTALTTNVFVLDPRLIGASIRKEF